MNLNKLDLKYITLIDLIYAQPLELDFLASQMNVSDRSVRNYIHDINSLESLNKIFTIEKSKDKYYAHVKQPKKYENFIHSIQNLIKTNLYTIEGKLTEVLKIYFKNDDYYTIHFLAEKLYVSRSTMVKNLKEMNELLKPYKLKLEGVQNKGVALKGSEHNKRDIFSKMLSENDNLIQELSSFYRFLDKDFISKHVIHIFENNKIKLSNELLNTIVNSILIIFVRHIKHPTSVSKKEASLFFNSNEYTIAQQILQSLNASTPFKETEIYYLMGTFYGKVLLESKDDSNPLTINSEVYLEIINEIHNQTGISIDDDELYVNLLFHLRQALERLKYNFGINNPLTSEIKETYPLPYIIAEIVAKITQRKFDITLPQEEIAYIALHFGSYVEKKISKIFSVNSILIVGGLRKSLNSLLENKLSNIFGEIVNIKHITDLELKTENLNDYDLIVTSVHYDFENESILTVNPLDDQSEIARQIVRHRRNNNPTLSLIFNFLNDRDYFNIITEDSYEQALISMIDHLSNKHSLDSQLKHRLINRELSSPTIFDNKAAFPHTVNKSNENDIILAFGVVKNKKLKAKIKIIILLIIPEVYKGNENDIILIYNDIMTFLQNDNNVNLLSEVEDYGSLLNIIDTIKDTI